RAEVDIIVVGGGRGGRSGCGGGGPARGASDLGLVLLGFAQFDFADARGEQQRVVGLLRVVRRRRHVDEHKRLRVPACAQQERGRGRRGDQQRTTRAALAFRPGPQVGVPSESCRRKVSLELRYGTCLSFFCSASMTLPSALSDLLMACASFSR